MGMMRRGRRELEYAKTEFGGTRTTAGFVKHLSVCAGDYFFHAPVKLEVKPRDGGLRSPVIRYGRYVHALPNGGECVGELA